jgi:hypothetical protein
MSVASTLHFPWSGIIELLYELRHGTTVKPLHATDTGKGLWLVGDQGVYLMANTSDGPRARTRPTDQPHFVVYARQCDPHKLPFDTWWSSKRMTFGGDDGVEFIPVAEIESLLGNPPPGGRFPLWLTIKFAPQTFTVGLAWRTASKELH